MPKKTYTPKKNDHSLYTQFSGDVAIAGYVKKMGPKYNELIQKSPETVYKALCDNIVYFAPGVDEDMMISVMKSCFKDYEVPSREVIEQRTKLSEDIQRKLFEIKAKNKIAFNASYPYDLGISYDRYYDVICYGDISPEGVKKNKEFYRKYLAGTKEEQIEANMELLKRVGNMDISHIDITDPQSIYDNLETLSEAMYIGAELQPIIARAKALGIDFNDPQLADFCTKAEAIYEIGMASRSTIDLYCMPMYRYAGDLNGPYMKNFSSEKMMPDGENTVSAYLSDFDYDNDLNDKDKMLTGFFDNAGYVYQYRGPYTDTDIKLEDRMKVYLDQFNDRLKVRTVEAKIPDTGVDQANYYDPSDPDIRRIFHTFVHDNRAALYAPQVQYFNPLLRSDMDRLCVLKEGKLVPAFPENDQPYPFGIGSDMTDEKMKSILTGGDYYYVKAGESKAYQLKDGKLSQEPSDLEIPAGLPSSGNDKDIHELELELYDVAKVKNSRARLYGKDFNKTGTEVYRDYDEKIVFNALKKNPDLAYPESTNKEDPLTDEDYQAITMFCYADPAVNGKKYYNGKGDPEAMTFAGLLMGPNDLYCMRAGKEGTENLNILVDSRAAAKELIIRHNQGQYDALAESIARGITVLAASAFSVDQMSPTSHNYYFPASSTYRFLKAHPEIYKLAREKAKVLAGNDPEKQKEALEKFDKGYNDCHRADNMIKIIDQGVDAEYRLNLYKTGKYKNEFGKICVPSAQEKKELEAKVILRNRLKEAIASYAKAKENNPETSQMMVEMFAKMPTLPIEERDVFSRYRTDNYNYAKVVKTPLDPFLSDLENDYILDIGKYVTKTEDIPQLKEFFAFKAKLKQENIGELKNPDFIKKMVELRFGTEKALDLDDGFFAADKYKRYSPDLEIDYFMGLDDKAFAEQCEKYMMAEDVAEHYARMAYTVMKKRTADIEGKLDLMMQDMNNIKDMPQFSDAKYKVLKSELSYFTGIYNSVKAMDGYSISDLEELNAVALRVSTYIGTLSEAQEPGTPLNIIKAGLVEIFQKTIFDAKANDIAGPALSKQLGAEFSPKAPVPAENVQNAPAEQTPEEKWYDSFVAGLEEMGISFDNPISLGLVREVNDRFDYARDVANLLDGDNGQDPDKVMEAMENMHKAYPMAFGSSKLQNRIYQGDNYGQFLKNNMRNPKELSLAEKKRLYMLAKDNKLFVQSPGSGIAASSDFGLVRIKEDGTAVITKPLLSLNPEKVLKQIETLKTANNPEAENVIAQLREEWKEKTTFYPEEMDDAIRAASDCGMVDQGKHAVCGDFIDMGIERKYGNLDNLTDVQKKALDSEKEIFLSKTKWALNGYVLPNLAVDHPELVKSEKDLDIQTRFLNIGAKPEEMRSPEEQKLFEENYVLRPENALIEKKLCKIFNVNSVAKVPFDKIKNDEGKAFGSSYSYETINKLGKHNVEGKSFEINGVKMIYSANNEKFIKEAPLELYAKEVDALVAELAATDSIFSKDTDSYVNFKNGLSELAQNIRGGLNSGVPDDRTFNTLHRLIDNVSDLGTKYQEAHAGIEDLSPRQKRRLAVMVKLQNLCDKSQPDRADVHPDDELTKLAEKIAIEMSIDLQGSKSRVNRLYGRSIEMSHHNMKIFTNDIRESDAFKALVHGESKDALNALLAQKPGVALKALQGQEAILKKQAEEAEKTAVRQDVKANNGPKLQ